MADEKSTTYFVNAIEYEVEEISKRILAELEDATSFDLYDADYAETILNLSDINYTKHILKEVGGVGSEDKNEVGKRAIIKVLLLSTWLQRLYFIIRSSIMGLMSGIVTALIILLYGTIDVVGGVFIGVFVFVFSLVITRLFDVQLIRVAKKIVLIMTDHRRVRDFVMNHF